MTAGPGVKPTRNTGRLDNRMTDAMGSELPFAAICISDRSADKVCFPGGCTNGRFWALTKKAISAFGTNPVSKLVLSEHRVTKR